mgnify:CR=1 FL=1
MKCPQKECHLQRLSKFLAYAGIASRRNSEKLIITGRVSVNGVIVINPATKVSNSDAIFFDGYLIKNELINPRMWIYHKPVGELCSDHDPYGKRKVFDSFPKNIGKVCLVGRLDYNSEGLLLLTNKGFIKRYLELPRNQVTRTYKVKVWGYNLIDRNLEPLRAGMTVSGINYAPMNIDLLSTREKISWLQISLSEGKNREIRRVLEKIGLRVSKLIRIKYGNFSLGTLKCRQTREISIPKALIKKIEK